MASNIFCAYESMCISCPCETFCNCVNGRYICESEPPYDADETCTAEPNDGEECCNDGNVCEYNNCLIPLPDGSLPQQEERCVCGVDPLLGLGTPGEVICTKSDCIQTRGPTVAPSVVPTVESTVCPEERPDIGEDCVNATMPPNIICPYKDSVLSSSLFRQVNTTTTGTKCNCGEECVCIDAVTYCNFTSPCDNEDICVEEPNGGEQCCNEKKVCEYDNCLNPRADGSFPEKQVRCVCGVDPIFETGTAGKVTCTESLCIETPEPSASPTCDDTCTEEPNDGEECCSEGEECIYNSCFDKFPDGVPSGMPPTYDDRCTCVEGIVKCEPNECRRILSNEPSVTPADPPTDMPTGIRSEVPTRSTPTPTGIRSEVPTRSTPPPTITPTRSTPPPTALTSPPTPPPTPRTPTPRGPTPTPPPPTSTPTRTPKTPAPTKSPPVKYPTKQPSKSPPVKYPTKQPSKSPPVKYPTKQPTKCKGGGTGKTGGSFTGGVNDVSYGGCYSANTGPAGVSVSIGGFVVGGIQMPAPRAPRPKPNPSPTPPPPVHKPVPAPSYSGKGLSYTGKGLSYTGKGQSLSGKGTYTGKGAGGGSLGLIGGLFGN